MVMIRRLLVLLLRLLLVLLPTAEASAGGSRWAGSCVRVWLRLRYLCI
jgi:hypothetical protein